MASYNRVILIGNLTRDPELKYIPSGTAVCEIGMAVNDRRKGPNGDWIEETTFVDITLWGRTAEVCSEYCSKGNPLFIEGRLKYDSWEKDGKKMSKLRVVADKLQLLGSRGGQGGGGGGSGGGSSSAGRGRPQQPSGPSYDEADYGAPSGTDSYGGSGSGGGGGGSDEIPF